MSVEAAYFLVGPTACGKSSVAQVLAERMGAGVVSADSMIVYRGLDIGTAKPTILEQGSVPYWGMDLVGPDQLFSVYDYRVAVRDALVGVDRPVIVAGGTGLYVKSLILGLDPQREGVSPQRAKWDALFEAQGIVGLQAALEACAPGALAALADPRNPRRVIRALERAEEPESEGRVWETRTQSVPVVGLQMDPAVLAARIATRVDQMYAAGLADEVSKLLAGGISLAKTAAQAIGYAEAIDYVRGVCTLEAAKERTVVRTRQLAKRQRTWFRHQVVTEWVEVGTGEDPGRVADRVGEVWERYGATPIRWD